MAMNERLTRLKERRVYFGSRLEGLGHYDREERRSLRWPVGHLNQKAKGHQWAAGFLISYFLLSLGAQLMVGCLQGYRFRVGRFFPLKYLWSCSHRLARDCGCQVDNAD